jgi:hypothetical protein
LIHREMLPRIIDAIRSTRTQHIKETGNE